MATAKKTSEEEIAKPAAKKAPAKKTAKPATKKAPAAKTAAKPAAKKSTKIVSEEKTAKKPTAKKTTKKSTAPKGTLVIVESPAKSKTIAKFLGSSYKVIASNGHVRDLPKSQLGVDVEDHFKAKYINLRGKADLLNGIKKAAKGAKNVLLATDPDREGEAISWHLANLLSIDQTSVCRIVFNEITPNAIKEAIAVPRAINMDVVDAQQTRRILDRLVGYKISPILWAKVRKGLSAGRVQSVATRIIVDREEEITAFVPEEYWNISVTLNEMIKTKAKLATIEAKLYSKNKTKIEKITSQQQAQSIQQELEAKQYFVSEIKKGTKIKNPSPPFTTSSLQQDAGGKLNFTTKRTMLVAQQLYEGVDVPGKGHVGLVTYIRTDSVRVAKSAQDQVREEIANRYGKQYVPAVPPVYKGKSSAQDAHEAIRPTYIEITPESIKSAITPEQYKLYTLIYNRFFASQMEKAQYTTVQISIEAGVYGFRASASNMTFDGFTKVYSDLNDIKAKETILPEVKKGDELAFVKYNSEQCFTSPPSRYTEASLVKALEEKGIGRPSTYSPTISTIIDRGYIKREKKNLNPTELGVIVTNIMRENFKDIVDVEFTAGMENQLDEVEEGRKSSEKVLEDFYNPFSKTLAIAEEQIEKIVIEDEISDIVCDKCGAMMVYKVGRFGKFLACPKFPECKNTKPILQKIDVPCPKCSAALIKRKAKKGGRSFYGCENFPECDFISSEKPTKTPCPKCGEYTVEKSTKTHDIIKCSNKQCDYSLETEKEIVV